MRLGTILGPTTFPNKPQNLMIRSELNRGALGIVYNGDLEGRPVAVKRIHELLPQKVFESFPEDARNFKH